MLPGVGRFVPPESREGRASNLRVTAPPYRRISQPREVPLNQLLEDVLDPQKRGPALIHLAVVLSPRRKTVPDFSLIVWRTPVIVTLILQEILRIYPYIHHQEQMPEDVCHRVSCALSLFQPIALDGRVRDDFLRAEIPQYLYPLVTNPRQSASFEKLRITSLGIIGFLVKEGVPYNQSVTSRYPTMGPSYTNTGTGTDHLKIIKKLPYSKDTDLEAVQFLLRSEVVPLCLRCMEVGTVLSKTVAVFILEKLLSTEIGLEYICENQERFLATNQMLASMFTTLPHVRSSLRLLSMSEITLYDLLPDGIRDGSCIYMFQDDTEIKNCVYQLLWNLGCIYNNNNNGINSYYGTQEETAAYY